MRVEQRTGWMDELELISRSSQGSVVGQKVSQPVTCSLLTGEKLQL